MIVVIKWIFIALNARRLQTTMPVTGSNLDILCIQQLDATPFYENYGKNCFDAKHLQKGLNSGWWNL